MMGLDVCWKHLRSHWSETPACSFISESLFRHGVDWKHGPACSFISNWLVLRAKYTNNRGTTQIEYEDTVEISN